MENLSTLSIEFPLKLNGLSLWNNHRGDGVNE